MSAPSFSFTLTPDPLTTATSAGAAVPAPGPVTRPPVKEGLLRPFRLDGKGGFARVSGDALLLQKLENLLLLEGLPWAQNRTTYLSTLRHMNAPAALVFARSYVADAVTRLLPEVRVEQVRVEDRKDGTLWLVVEVSKVRDPAQSLTASRVLR